MGEGVVFVGLKTGGCYQVKLLVQCASFQLYPSCMQVGPCTGIAMGDQLWMSRYLMYRVCEMYNVSRLAWWPRG